MALKLRIALIIAIIIYFMLLFQLLKSKRLNLKYTLLWILLGVVMLFMTVIPDALLFFTESVGIVGPMNGLFATVCFCILIILMSITAIVSKLNEKNKRLIQSLAILEKRVRIMENELSKKDI